MNMFERVGIPLPTRKLCYHIGQKLRWRNFLDDYEGFVEGVEVRRFLGFAYYIKYQLRYAPRRMLLIDEKYGDEPEYNSTKKYSQFELKKYVKKCMPLEVKVKPAKTRQFRLTRTEIHGSYEQPLRYRW